MKAWATRVLNIALLIIRIVNWWSFFSDEEYKKFINNNYYDRVTYVLVIDDDSVTSNEILVDLYSFDDGDLIYVYTLDNLENKYSLFPPIPKEVMVICPF